MPRINAFKIDISKIPSINYYRLNEGFQNDAEMFSFSWRNGGIFWEDYFLTPLEYSEIPDKDRLKQVKSFPFLSKDLNTETRIDLLHRYTSFKLKKLGVLKKIKNNIKQSLLERGI
ncbi:MAG: hypothetical protein ABIL42_02495, partial [candidate division WOR-3 bacterium]